MIDLLNKSPLIKAQVTTRSSLLLVHFVSFVKQQCFSQYEYFCNVGEIGETSDTGDFGHYTQLDAVAFNN